jgi:shikimate kinase / 3-dehydroquinate synthase
VIEQRSGRTVREIFAQDGESEFRALEHAVVADLLGGPDVVLALGGGAPEHSRTRDLLRAGPSVVYLQVGYAQAMARVAGDEYRPMLHRPGLDDLYQRRLDIYGDLATLTIATDGRRPETVASDVVEHLVRAPRVPAGTSTILVSCTGGTYNVHVGAGLLEQAGALLPELPYTRTAVLITADITSVAPVADSLRQARDLAVHVIEVPDQQSAKELATVGSVAGELAERAVHKDDLIIGVGARWSATSPGSWRARTTGGCRWRWFRRRWARRRTRRSAARRRSTSRRDATCSAPCTSRSWCSPT